MIILILIIVHCIYCALPLELRIYEGAKPGIRMTIDEDLENELKHYRDCFFELESNITWFHFNEELWSFETVAEVTQLPRDESVAMLNLLCADATQSRSIQLNIQITRQNRYAPMFTQQNYVFYVPLNTRPGTAFGRVEVVDKDPVIYNSQTRITILPNEGNDLLEVDHNGTVKLKKKVFYYPPFKPINFKLSAIDFGSPQKHAEANLTFIPVTITQVRKVTVNVANVNYQIFEWEHPEYGVAERYRLIVRNKAHIEYEGLVDGQLYMAYFKHSLEPDTDYTLQIEAIDADGKTPSNKIRFQVTSTELHCDGSCSPGGHPICFFSPSRELRQYTDENGEHCICFQGYSGISCEIIEHCNEEETVEVFGRIRWSRTAVNRTKIVPCPFGSKGDYIRRRCYWNLLAGVATWQSLAGDETCRKQNSVINELNIVLSYIRNTSTSHISAVNAIDHVVDQLLEEAAFMPNISNVYFDGVVAERMTSIIADTLFRNWRDNKGNYTDVQKKLFTLTTRLCDVLPVPYSITSSQQKLALKTLELVPNAETYRTIVGNTCAIHPALTNYSNILRAICMEYATLYFELDEKSPVLVISRQNESYRQSIQIELKAHTKDVNYTCVRYDETSEKWTNDGIELLESDQDFVVCRTLLTGKFSLLPLSNFAKNHFFEQISTAIPTFSAILAALGCLILCLITVFRRKRIDPVISYLFMLGFLLHLVQAALLLSPEFVSVFYEYDPNFEITLYFLSISIIFAIAYSSFSIHSYLPTLNSGTFNAAAAAVSYIRCSIVSICVFAIPLLCTVSFSLFRTDNNSTFIISSMDTRYGLHYIIPTAVTFAVIFVYCTLIFKQTSRNKKRYRYTEDKTTRRSADLFYSAICLIFLYLVTLCDTILFSYRSSFPFILLHCTILVLFIILCYLFFTSLVAIYSNRFHLESPTRSLERKRDISRGDLLERDKNELLHFPLSDNSLDSPNDLSNNIFHSQIYGTSKPMVSIV